MRNAALCTEDEIRQLVYAFYDRVRSDAILAPVFNAHIAPDEWPAHLNKMVDFWSSLLLGTARFSGTPMTRHAALPDISPEHFQHWIALFDATAATLDNQAMAERARMMARRIARSLWLGYQTSNFPDRLAADLALPA
ncbi:MAG: group III truncated hemoglobin [Pigmentiphaga sp.]|nr:group III truncated hemoglobin [Pigmentiphaga sp.]